MFVFAATKVWGYDIYVTAGSSDELTKNGSCSIREAVINSNANATTKADCPLTGSASTNNRIIISAGTYSLTDTTNGDLDLNVDVEIIGAGDDVASGTIINASGIDDNTFDVSKDITVTFDSIRITGGKYGIHVIGDVTINSSTITSNLYGGVSMNTGKSATINSSTITNNGSSGIGCTSYCSSLTIDSSTITNNQYGIYVGRTEVTQITNSVISDNSNTGIFFDIYEDTEAHFVLDSSTVSGNQVVGVYISGYFDLGEPTHFFDTFEIKDSTITGNGQSDTDLGGSIFLYFESAVDTLENLEAGNIDFDSMIGSLILDDYFKVTGATTISGNNSLSGANCNIANIYYYEDSSEELGYGSRENIDFGLSTDNANLELTSDCIFVLDSTPEEGGTTTSGGSSTSGTTTAGETSGGSGETSGSSGSGGTSGGAGDPDPDSGNSEKGGGCSLVME